MTFELRSLIIVVNNIMFPVSAIRLRKLVLINELMLFIFWIFSVCAPQLSGRILFALRDARAIFLHTDLLCNGTYSVTGGRITYWGGGDTNGKDPIF